MKVHTPVAHSADKQCHRTPMGLSHATDCQLRRPDKRSPLRSAGGRGDGKRNSGLDAGCSDRGGVGQASRSVYWVPKASLV
jgi:hypothetical protein